MENRSSVYWAAPGGSGSRARALEGYLACRGCFLMENRSCPVYWPAPGGSGPNILYSFLPNLYGFSSELSSFLPNSEISSRLFYVLSDPKFRTSERDLSYPKNVPTISPLTEIRGRRSSGRLRKRGLDVYNFSSELENLCGWRLKCPDHIQYFFRKMAGTGVRTGARTCCAAGTDFG